MVALRSLVILSLLTAALAGCADDAPKDTDELAKAAANVQVEATDTTGVIRGVVVDEALRPLAGALVVLQNMDKNVTTNADGAFGFEGLEAGTYFLTAALEDYTSVQQSVDVVAGVSDPAVVKVLLAAIPRGTPSIEAHTALIFISGSGWLQAPQPVGGTGLTVGGAGVLGEGGNWFFVKDITPNGTIVQTELVWDATTPLGEGSYVYGGPREDDGGYLSNTDYYGGSPMVMRANATEGSDTAADVRYNLYAFPVSDTPPVGFHLNQMVDVYIHVFYNFMPRDGWTFTADGPHAVPEK